MGSYMSFRPDFSHVLIFEGRIFDNDYFHLLGKEMSFLISFYGDCIKIF